MGLLRGKTERDDQTVDPAAGQPQPARGQTPAKGRPTPTRREARGGARGPVPPPPRTQREAFRRMRRLRDRRRGTRADRKQRRELRRERMQAGDERYLPARDRGPERAMARDLVDARRTLLPLFMPVVLVVLVALFIPSPVLVQVASATTTAMFLYMLVEGTLIGGMVNRRVRERFPDTGVSKFALGFYAFSRVTQPRLMRMPKPRVARGARL